jgi:hypothetical protein
MVTTNTEERWHMDWDIPGAVGIIRDQDDNDIAVIEIQPMDEVEAERIANLMIAAPLLYEALAAIAPSTEGSSSEWRCPECKEWLPGSRVTHEEYCDTCGAYLGDVNDPEWLAKTQAALALARGEASE